MAEAQWKTENCPVSEDLNAISSAGNNSLWVVGDNGVLLYKKNGSWVNNDKLTTEDLYCICMIDDNNGWAVGAKGTIIRYSNKIWQKFTSPTTSNLFSVYFKDKENGIAVGESGTFLIYRDGIWSSIEIKVRGNLTASFYGDAVWIGGGLECVSVPIMKFDVESGIKLSSTTDPHSEIKSIFFTDADNGWAAGSPGTLLHFNGYAWEKPDIGCRYSSLNSIYFADNNNGICVGYDGTILTYSNGIWVRESSDLTSNFKGTLIIDRISYAVGEKGTIIKKDLSENTHKYVSGEASESISIYPNPCDDILNVILNEEMPDSDGKISIFNCFGQKVYQKTLKKDELKKPKIITTGNLKDGLYLVRITAEFKTTIRKFVVRH
jgi:photosystem II stability/assembly factor-like uncharacterized protein